jgi:hypothetical protein
VLISLLRQGRNFKMRSRWMVVIGATMRVVSSLRARVGRPEPRQVVVIEHEHVHRHDVAHGHTHPSLAADRSAGPRGAVEPDEHVTEPTPGVAGAAHRHRHRHVLPVPADPFAGPGPLGALGVGALHGVGAETPTQVVVFVGAAGASGRLAGLCILASFIAGLVLSNTAVAALATFGRIGGTRRFPVYVAISVLTAVFSLVMGVVFVTGHADGLPTILG